MLIEKRSTTQLTEAQVNFYKYVRIRATDASVGQPYIAPALFKLTPVNAKGLRTMAVDKYWRVYIDFDYFMAMPDGIRYAASFLAHEPWHLLRDHEVRFTELDGDIRDKDAKQWNIAGDLEINDDIPEKVTKDACFPGAGAFVKFEKFKSAEFYYNLLSQHPEIMEKFQPPKPECTCGDKGKQQGGKQDKGDQGGQQPGDKGQGKNQQGQDGQGQGQGQQGDGGSQPGGSQPGGQGGQPGQGQGGQPGDQDGEGGHEHGDGSGTCPIHDPQQIINCGSGSGNDLSDWEIGYDAENGIDEEGHDAIKREIAENIKQQERMGIGNIPGFASEWAGQVLAHKPVDWRAALRAQVKYALNFERIRKLDYTPRRPKRRQPIPDVLLPGMHAPKPTLMLGFDTSGSNMHNMGVILDEVCNIVRQVGVRGKEFRSFAVDVDVDKIIPVSNPKKLLDNRRMYGGTQMRPAYELAAKQKGHNRPGCFILMTDGEVFEDDLPNEVPAGGQGIRYITCIITQKGDTRPFEAAKKRLSSWGSVIHIETE